MRERARESEIKRDKARESARESERERGSDRRTRADDDGDDQEKHGRRFEHSTRAKIRIRAGTRMAIVRVRVGTGNRGKGGRDGGLESEQ